jgi:hypothetical protein
MRHTVNQLLVPLVSNGHGVIVNDMLVLVNIYFPATSNLAAGISASFVSQTYNQERHLLSTSPENSWASTCSGSLASRLCVGEISHQNWMSAGKDDFEGPVGGISALESSVDQT